MRLLLLFLFTVSANAAFIPIPSAPINYYAVGVLGKGELLTSDGVSNGTQAACADDEILVWDGSLPSGVKCEAKPSGGATDLQDVIVSPTSVTSGGTTVATFAPITVGAGKVVNFNHYASPLINNNSALWFYGTAAICTYQLLRNGTVITASGFDNSTATSSGGFHFTDFPPAGTHTYTFVLRLSIGSGTCGFNFPNVRSRMYIL